MRRSRSVTLATGTLLAFMLAACGGSSDAADHPGDEGWPEEEFDGGSEVDDRDAVQPPVETPPVTLAPPTTSPPATTPPATTPPAVEPPTVEEVEPEPTPPTPMIPSGMNLVFEVTEDISTASHLEGERFALRLVEGVRGEHGASLPAGTPAIGVVTNSERSAGADSEAVLAVRIASVEIDGRQYDMDGTIRSADIEAGTRDSGRRSAATVATGAAAGAIVGQILGRDTRSTVTGAAVGAAAGLGVALTTRDGHAVLPRGSIVTVRLDRPIIVQ